MKYIAQGSYLILTGLWAIIRVGTVGLVKAGLSSITAKVLLKLTSVAIASSVAQQWAATLVLLASIIAIGWKAKQALYSLPLGVKKLKKAFGK